jgi:hypothetical protein
MNLASAMELDSANDSESTAPKNPASVVELDRDEDFWVDNDLVFVNDFQVQQ